MTLSFDTARCAGVQYDGDWREGGEDCMRRTSPGGEWQAWMEPPAVIAFWCEFHIEPRKT